MPVISLQNRCKIIQYYLLNKTIFIQKRLKINKSTIWKIIEKWKRNGTVENAKKPGRVRKSDKLTERTIIKTSRGNPFLNSTQIAREVSPFLKISSSLVRKILIRHGLRARISIKKPFITSLNVQKRKNWCRQMVGLGDGFWENVVFFRTRQLWNLTQHDESTSEDLPEKGSIENTFLLSKNLVVKKLCFGVS